MTCPNCDTFAKRLEEAEKKIERLKAEGYACGRLNEHEGLLIGGCGLHVDRESSYRCSDCTASFHRDCIRQHFETDAMIKARREVREEIMTYKATISKQQETIKKMREYAQHKTLCTIHLSGSGGLHGIDWSKRLPCNCGLEEALSNEKEEV